MIKTFIVRVVNEQEITMEIKADSIERVKDLIEDDYWTNYIEDQYDDEDEVVAIKATRGFKVKETDWKIKSITPKRHEVSTMRKQPSKKTTSGR